MITSFRLGYLSPILQFATGWRGGLENNSPQGERGNLLLIFYLLVDQEPIFHW